MTGDYTLTNTDTGSYANSQTGSGVGQLATATESGGYSWSTSETGNSLAGTYAGEKRGRENTDAEFITSVGVRVTQTSAKTGVLVTYSGERAAGSMASTATGTDTYSTVEFVPVGGGKNRGLEVDGVMNFTRTEAADGTTGQSVVGTSGTDQYVYQVIDPVANTTVTVRGTEEVSEADTANSVTGIFTRSVVSNGVYVDADAQGTPTGTPTNYGYTVNSKGNPQSGKLTQTASGANRYQLLPGWVDAAQVNGANGVGSVQFNPFGAAYNLRDPGSMDRGNVVFGGGLAEVRSGSERTGSAILDGYSIRGQELYAQSCFRAGVPILWELGAKGIELIRAGDRVWSRDENDPSGEIELKVVEEVFVRHSLIWEVDAGGQIIGTTAEHPFHVLDRGWVKACMLEAGDRISCKDGSSVAVREVRDSGQYETVYNFRVADWHTYFVGCDEWGWAGWVHNAEYIPENLESPSDQAQVELIRRHADAHAFERHGGQITDAQLITRATTGVAPDGTYRTKPNGDVIIPPLSTKFHSDVDLVMADLELRSGALADAIAADPTAVNHKVSAVELGFDLGYGYKRVGATAGASIGMAGPPLRVDGLTKATAVYERDSVTGDWLTITIYPSD